MREKYGALKEAAPCPCGSEDLELYNYCVYTAVKCQACGRRGEGSRQTEAAAVRLWNDEVKPSEKEKP